MLCEYNFDALHLNKVEKASIYRQTFILFDSGNYYLIYFSHIEHEYNEYHVLYEACELLTSLANKCSIIYYSHLEKPILCFPHMNSSGLSAF